MIVVTGALGFIGSNVIRKLNEEGLQRKIIAVDDFYKSHKESNLKGQYIQEWIHRSIFLQIFEKMTSQIKFVFHLGARTDTTETDTELLEELNVAYSKRIWELCSENNIPLLYASSAATYGDGSKGFSDAHEQIKDLQALNPYGKSKQDFDLWVLAQKQAPPFWQGYKFFNVYGSGERHKGAMASVAYHTTPQAIEEGKIRLFKSEKKGVADGEQKRDFIFIDDVIEVLWHFYKNQDPQHNGIYNVGSGAARSFNELANAIFNALDINPRIEYFEMPANLKDTYQYYTQADVSKLRKAGYQKPFTTLEEGIKKYVDALK